MKMKNKNFNNIPDEREQLISLKACLAGFVFVLVCLFVAFTVNIINTGEPGWELWGFLGACIVVIIANRVHGNVEQPKDIFNRPLPTGNTKEERKKRIAAYMLDAVLTGFLFAVFDVIVFLSLGEEMIDMEIVQSFLPNLSDTALVVVTALFIFVTMFIISFIFDYLVGEFYKVRRYNKMLAEFDDDENE